MSGVKIKTDAGITTQYHCGDALKERQKGVARNQAPEVLL